MMIMPKITVGDGETLNEIERWLRKNKVVIATEAEAVISRAIADKQMPFVGDVAPIVITPRGMGFKKWTAYINFYRTALECGYKPLAFQAAMKLRGSITKGVFRCGMEAALGKYDDDHIFIFRDVGGKRVLDVMESGFVRPDIIIEPNEQVIFGIE
jgi:hypothetical protein